MVDLSTLSDEDLELMSTGNVQGMSDQALEALVAGRPVKPSLIQRTGQFLARNGEIPGSVAGGLSGAAAGTAFGPVGTVIGGIVGGAVGATGGSLASDVYEGERLDFEEAVKEGATSAVFDTATLGAGKLLRPIAKSIGVNVADLFMNVTGRGRTARLPSLSTLPTNVAAGSDESLKITQQLLEEGGGSLSATQTGQASFLRATADEIGEIGLFSGAQAKKRVEANNAILTREVQRLVDGVDPTLARTANAVGEEIYGIVEAGRRAAGQLYGEGLAKITNEFGVRNINPSRFRTALTKFNKENSSEIGDMLTKQTRTFVDDIESRLQVGPNMKLSTLFDLDKLISRNIDQAMPGNAFADAASVRQLSQLRTNLREATEATLSKQAPVAGRAYKALKAEYGDSMGDLLPKMGQSVIRAAEAGDFDRLGNLLIKQTNVSKIGAFMKSIDRAYVDIAKAKGVAPSITSANQAKDLVRQSFVRNVFADVQGEGTDFKNFRALAHRLSSDEALQRSKAILGDKYGSYKRLVNAISDSTVDGKRGLFNLAIRSQEINSVGRLGVAGASAGGAFALAGLPMAVGILTLPSVLAKIATNNRAVNRLLALNGAVKKDLNISPELITSGLAKVFAELSDEERESLQRDLDRPLAD